MLMRIRFTSLCQTGVLPAATIAITVLDALNSHSDGVMETLDGSNKNKNNNDKNSHNNNKDARHTNNNHSDKSSTDDTDNTQVDVIIPIVLCSISARCVCYDYYLNRLDCL